MERSLIPKKIPNWINGREKESSSGELFDKLNPANGNLLCKAARSNAEDVARAVTAARQAQPAWADTPAVQRGMMLHDIVKGMQKSQEEIAQRLDALPDFEPKTDSSWLRRYARMVTSASQGAVLV